MISFLNLLTAVQGVYKCHTPSFIFRTVRIELAEISGSIDPKLMVIDDIAQSVGYDVCLMYTSTGLVHCIDAKVSEINKVHDIETIFNDLEGKYTRAAARDLYSTLPEGDGRIEVLNLKYEALQTLRTMLKSEG